MKELVGTAANLACTWNETKKQFTGSAEIVLIVSEPHWDKDAHGELFCQRACSEIRFCACPDALRDLAKSINKWADMQDEIAAKANSGTKEA